MLKAKVVQLAAMFRSRAKLLIYFTRIIVSVLRNVLYYWTRCSLLGVGAAIWDCQLDKRCRESVSGPQGNRSNDDGVGAVGEPMDSGWESGESGRTSTVRRRSRVGQDSDTASGRLLGAWELGVGSLESRLVPTGYWPCCPSALPDPRRSRRKKSNRGAALLEAMDRQGRMPVGPGIGRVPRQMPGSSRFYSPDRGSMVKSSEKPAALDSWKPTSESRARGQRSLLLPYC
ncbi:hypothetical protein K402DRAFT_142362 [Aulographum hederae CBS 113979]|uniref:Uncharacterized protein n=1 Tax=Aulographum hederae CBS 113979 TaxID=1176131 RepID=A0A6G1GU66_9PEZI|nr:hypothetical protein K402DRAFT_142362 [Aulographum hederae CBS 113979]